PGKVMLGSSVVDPHAIVKPVQSEFLAHELETIVKDASVRVTHPWFVKLPVSPDFSSIDYKKPGDPGINIGLLGEYQLSRHFSLSTGAIWSKKLYDTENPDKSYSSGSWSAKASKLDGDCRVLDIPINVTYYIFPERRTNLFVTVGASSYIMLKEQYVYTVWANQKEYQYEEEFSHKNNEWFSMLNLSVGIQQRLGKGFFLQAEPFLKAPMSGVGEGKVNLVSTGVFVSLKYQLTK
ncbi:MAG TPA: outer membrane beta-barrel protein, partial [Chryseolinea sp.]|nr:outer membrane beta-barrel protein [Chryseolinea sp.]